MTCMIHGKEAMDIIRRKCPNGSCLTFNENEGDDYNIKAIGEFAIELNKRKVKC